MENKNLRILTQSAMLIAAALVVKVLSAQILPGIYARINIYGSFSQMIPILFGPLWGGISAAVLDVTALLVMNQGSFLPHITIIEFLCGILLGLGWRYVKLNNIFIKSFILIIMVDIIHSTLNSIGFALFIPGILGERTFVLFWGARLGTAVTFAAVRSILIAVFYTIYKRYIKN